MSEIKEKKVKKIVALDKIRVSIFRSNKSIYAQAVDDSNSNTIASVSSKELKEKSTPINNAFSAGEMLAKKLLDFKIGRINYDRNGYRYHGLVKAFAEGMRKGGSQF